MWTISRFYAHLSITLPSPSNMCPYVLCLFSLTSSYDLIVVAGFNIFINLKRFTWNKKKSCFFFLFKIPAQQFLTVSSHAEPLFKNINICVAPKQSRIYAKCLKSENGKSTRSLKLSIHLLMRSMAVNIPRLLVQRRYLSKESWNTPLNIQIKKYRENVF